MPKQPKLQQQIPTTVIPVANDINLDVLPTISRGYMVRFTVNHDNAVDLSGFEIQKLVRSLTNILLNDGFKFIKHNCDGFGWYLLNYYLFKGNLSYSIDSTAGAGKESYVDLFLPFVMLDGISPEDTMLILDGMKNAYLQIMTGTLTHTNLTVNNFYFEMMSDDYVCDAGEKAQMQAFYGKLGNPDFRVIKTTENMDITGSDISVDIPNDRPIRKITFCSVDASTLVPVESAITKLRIEDTNGDKVFYTSTRSQCKYKNSMDYDIAIANLIDGTWVVDFTRMGKNSQALQAHKYTSIKAKVDVASTHKLLMYIEKL